MNNVQGNNDYILVIFREELLKNNEKYQSISGTTYKRIITFKIEYIMIRNENELALDVIPSGFTSWFRPYIFLTKLLKKLKHGTILILQGTKYGFNVFYTG